MSLKEWLKEYDWILLFYVIGFTAGIIVVAMQDYNFIKNIFFVWGLIMAYVCISLFRDREINGKPYNKKEILKMIDESPDIDYVGEYLKERLEVRKK